MSARVETALEQRSQLIIEAGTGVGKTFAYLVPALLSRQKVVISTGTRHLQDQLYFKDLPAVLDIVKTPVSTGTAQGPGQLSLSASPGTPCSAHTPEYRPFGQRKSRPSVTGRR